MRLGLEREGWRIAFANDIDPQKEEMYRANFPDADRHFVLGDIHALPVSKIPTVALATASFPCNDLSLAGSRRGLEGKNSSAFWGFVKILREMKQRRPPLVLIENVTGFLTSHNGRDFENALLALNELGYAVDPFILDAAWFVPQSRQRLFVVGTRTQIHDADAVAERFTKAGCGQVPWRSSLSATQPSIGAFSSFQIRLLDARGWKTSSKICQINLRNGGAKNALSIS